MLRVLSAFLCRNTSFLLAFLLMVDGLSFFPGPLGSREKVRVEPADREKVKGYPLATSAWQMSRHL